LRHIHIDLAERTIVFAAEDERATKLTLTPEGVIYEVTDSSGQLAAGESAIDAGDEESLPEREPTVRLTGKLKSVPRDGRVDSSGHPTAWARFAAHEDGRDEAHVYLATFHRHTRDIAFSLPLNSSLVVEGYPHVNETPGRLDTLSVVSIVNYPGKPPRRGGR
jgi:hypothetical protein